MRLRWVLGLLTIAALAFGTGAQESRPVEAVRGKIAQVHPLGVVTVALPDPGSGDAALLRDFLVTSKVELALDGKPCELRDLARGLEVLVIPSESDLPPIRIEAFSRLADGQAHKMQGAVEAVGESSIEILLDNRDRRTGSTRVTADTVVRIDGQLARLGQVKRRMYAIVTYVGEDAKVLDARTWIDDDKVHNVNGAIRTFGEGVLVLRYGSEQDGFDIKLACSQKYQVLNGTEAASVSELVAGRQVRVTYRNGGIEVVNLALR